MTGQRGGGANLIPTQCPKFFAAFLTVGGSLESGTPGISNTYDKAKKYDPDEPGTISYHLDRKTIDPLAVAKVWRNPEADLAESAALSQRLIKARTDDDWLKLADDIESLHVSCAVAHMRLFSARKFAIDSRVVSDQETIAAQSLSDMPERIRKAQKRNGARLASDLSAIWQPAMFAWVKAWAFNYLEHRDAWKAANPSIKIERDSAFPLVIPKGKDFSKLMKRWAR